MLVLSRFVDEEIIVGENAEVVIQVTRIQGNRVKIGVRAAKDVPVHRAEVYFARKKKKREAAEREGTSTGLGGGSEGESLSEQTHTKIFKSETEKYLNQE